MHLCPRLTDHPRSARCSVVAASLQEQYNDRAVGMPVVEQRHVPTIQRMLTLEVSHVQYIVSTTTPTVMCETAH